MKLIRIGNDIQIEWAITRYGEPEDFSNKNLSVGLYDKFNNKQIFEYTIEDNVISGIFYGKDQTTNGVYRLYLTENYDEEDMISLDYIDCFCLSNKLKNQTSNGKDSSNINTEVVQLSSSINVGGTIVQSDWNENDPDSPNYIKNKPEIFSGDYDDLTNKPTIPTVPTNVSAFTNDAGYINHVKTINNESIIGSGNITITGVTSYNDLTDKPFIPSKTSDLTNDSNFVSSSILSTVATSGNYNDLINKPTLFSGNYNDLTNKPSIPTKTSDLTNDSGYINQIKTINHMSLIGEGNINIGGGGTITVQADWAETDPQSDSYIQNKPTIPSKTSDLTNDSNFVVSSSLATVATSGNYNDLTNKPTLFSGNYNDLTNKPTIPSKTSDLTNDSGFVTSSSLATVATSGDYDDLSNKPTIPAAQIQSDWNQTNSSSKDYIKNKPTIPTVPTNVSAFTNDAGYVASTALATVATSGDYVDLSNKPSIPSKTSDLTNDSNFVVSSSLATVATSGNYNDLTNKPTIPTVPTNVSAFTNDAGYVASTALATVATSGDYMDLSNTPSIPSKTSDLTNDSNFVTSSMLAAVATSGSYNDLLNKPSIPSKTSDLTNDSNFVTSSMLAAVATSGSYNDLLNKPSIPSNTSDLTNDSDFITSSALTNYVTLNTAQNISGTKTFLGEKKIIFKQSLSTNKLGFTLYSNGAVQPNELGSFEFRPSTITENNVTYPLLYFGHYRGSSSSATTQTYIGFRQYDYVNSAAYHYLIPLPELAKSTFSLTTTFQNFYAPLGFKLNSTQTKKADNKGLVDISDCVTSTNTELKIEVVSVMPANPDANTLYIVA